MLDIKRIRENLDDIKKAMERRGEREFDLDAVVELDNKRREILQEVEVMKNELNVNSKKIPQLIKEGKDVTEEKARLKELSDKIKGIDEKVKEVEAKMEYTLMRIPNVPHPEVPQGETDEDNVQIRTWGEPTKFDFEHKAHWDIGTGLGILDFERAGKITGSRFTLYRGLGARLERSLMNFFLNTHTAKHGYTEVLPPFMANRNSFIGTGQLPKFEEDMFKIEGLEYFLIPTAEVPVTNIHANEILDVAELPIKYCAYTPCFRSEAGSAGRDTTHDAETMLQMLGLPYRVVKICTGDLGFTAAFKYDLEVWMPSYNRYVEISSCSNFEDFQARRAGIRFKRDKKSKAEYVHTLNGSGLAIGRCLAAILENYQQADGSVVVPEELRPYMGVDVIK